MKKKLPFIIAVVVIVLLLGTGVFFVLSQSKDASKQSAQALSPTPTPTVEMATWEDQAGFTFEYPKSGFTIDKNESDEINYAHIDFTKEGSTDKLTIWAQDPPKAKKGGKIITDISTWAKEPDYAGALAVDTTLGGEPAKKLMLPDPDNKIITAAYFDGLLYWIETPANNEDLKKLHDQITGSLKFFIGDKPEPALVSDDSAPAAADVGSGDVEEETIE